VATLKELISQLRIDLDDPDYGDDRSLWSDSELLNYLNRAQDEACLRSRMLLDSETRSICEIQLLPSVHTYDVDCRVFWIKRAKIDGQSCQLEPTGHSDMDYYRSGNWEEKRSRYPTHYMTDMNTYSLRVYPVPTEASVLWLTVFRKPLGPMELDLPECKPEIPEIHHWNMLEWAKHLAYAKHDGDAFDPEASARHASMFAQFFGERNSAELLELLRTKRPMRVRSRFM